MAEGALFLGLFFGAIFLLFWGSSATPIYHTFCVDCGSLICIYLFEAKLVRVSHEVRLLKNRITLCVAIIRLALIYDEHDSLKPHFFTAYYTTFESKTFFFYESNISGNYWISQRRCLPLSTTPLTNTTETHFLLSLPLSFHYGGNGRGCRSECAGHC